MLATGQALNLVFTHMRGGHHVASRALEAAPNQSVAGSQLNQSLVSRLILIAECMPHISLSTRVPGLNRTANRLQYMSGD